LNTIRKPILTVLLNFPYNLQKELATQIYAECEKLVPNECVTLVGGIAIVKQKRLLSTKRPSVIVATPGRLWAMVSKRKLSMSMFEVWEEKNALSEHQFFDRHDRNLEIF
jgi:hypothetical protein